MSVIPAFKFFLKVFILNHTSNRLKFRYCVTSVSDGEDGLSGATSYPNPNNPMEYCSRIPPQQQVGEPSGIHPTVMVPVGVLKRENSGRVK